MNPSGKRPPVVHYRLGRASPAIKVLTTGALVLTLVGIIITFFFAHKQNGLSIEGLTAHYAGGDELAEGTQLYFAIDYETLLRITHVHAFGMGMLLYIYGHMLTLTARSERFKVWVIAAMFGGLAAFLASLWLIRYLSPVFGVLFLAGFLAALGGLAVTAWCVLWETWFAGEKGEYRQPVTG